MSLVIDPTTHHFVAQRNDWESDFFQRNIWTLIPGGDTASCVGQHLNSLADVDLWECRLPLSRADIIETLFGHGFYLCDSTCEFSFDLAKEIAPQWRRHLEFRFAADDDIAGLKALMTTPGFATRFSRHPFTASDAARFYGEWLQNAVRGLFDDLCVVLLHDGNLAGFVTIKDVGESEARIGLIYVASHARGLGAGALLLSHAAQLVRRRGRTVLYLATQATNREAIALCLRLKGQLGRTGVHLYLPRRRPVSPNA